MATSRPADRLGAGCAKALLEKDVLRDDLPWVYRDAESGLRRLRSQARRLLADRLSPEA